MKTLCLDTSTLASMALVEDGRVLASVTDANPRHQAEGMGTLLRALLARAGEAESVNAVGIGRVVVGVGPGPYTALRAGIAFAAAVGRGMRVPVLGVCSLDALGRQLLDGDAEVALVLTDAKRKEVYSARYRARGRDDVEVLAGPQVGSLESALAHETGFAQRHVTAFARPRPVHLDEQLSAAGVVDVNLDVAILDRIAKARIAAGADDASFSLEPLYLRRPDIHQKRS